VINDEESWFGKWMIVQIIRRKKYYNNKVKKKNIAGSIKKKAIMLLRLQNLEIFLMD